MGMVEVRLFAYLRDNRDKRVYVEASTVKEVLEKLGISEEDAYKKMINGVDSTYTSELSDGDVLSIFPQVGGG